jgi:hypothetical protein
VRSFWEEGAGIRVRWLTGMLGIQVYMHSIFVEYLCGFPKDMSMLHEHELVLSNQFVAKCILNHQNKISIRSKLKEHMQYCVDHPEEISKLAKVKAQVSEVKGVMMENIEKVIKWTSLRGALVCQLNSHIFSFFGTYTSFNIHLISGS